LDVRNSQSGSISVVQTEDEISAIGMMIGAALTGVRSSTSTSGPGFSLMAEALGWAGINEVPVVITLYQRSGPSTGLPTRHGQDDLLFAVFGGHGEFPRIVYASGDIEESFYDTCLCFNYSDVYQLPVIHMMDKFLSSTTATCPIFDPSRATIDRGKLLDSIEDEYQRFQLGGDGISPRSYLGLKNGIFWNTGDESDETGHITEDPVVRRQMMDKRLARMDIILERVPEDEQVVCHRTGEYTIVSWGSTKGPILDALEMLESEGVSVGFIQVKMLHPFPTKCVERLLKGVRVVIDVESNQTGQMGKLFSQNMFRRIDHYILKYTGRAMTCDELRDAILDIIRGGAPYRTVLMRGS
jgi:2-oxoglutarate ferredoxin oxidoreductase subunit alpha